MAKMQAGFHHDLQGKFFQVADPFLMFQVNPLFSSRSWRPRPVKAALEGQESENMCFCRALRCAIGGAMQAKPDIKSYAAAPAQYLLRACV
jgi:hypothetical protein